MEVSNRFKETDTEGEELIQQLISLTGLPAPAVHQQLEEILNSAGHKSEGLTLDQLREAMLTYLMTLESESQGPQ